MALENQLVNQQHTQFFELMLEGSSIAEAGKKAGFTNPYRDVWPLVVEPTVQRMARKRMRGKLELEAAPQAYRILMNLMNDPTTDKRLRADIAKYLHTSAGYVPPKAGTSIDDASREKAPHEMSTEELHKFIEDGEAELGNRAGMIDVTPTTSCVEPAPSLADML